MPPNNNYPGAPPGYVPPPAPGFLQSSAMAYGVGAPYGAAPQYMQSGARSASAQFGANVLGGGVNAINAGIGLASATAPFFANSLINGGGSAASRAAGYVWRGLDPFHYGGIGASVGSGLARGLGATGGGIGAMAVRGGAYALGGVTGIGLAMAALEATRRVGTSIAMGGINAMGTQAMMSTMTRPGSSMGLSASTGFSQELTGMGRDVGMSNKEMRNITQQFNQMGVFQTTRTLREFKSAMTKAFDTVKEIAKITQSTIEEATGTFAQLRQQGVLDPSKMAQTAASMKVGASTAGLSSQQMMGMRGYGSDVARNMGMRGRVGADAAVHVTRNMGYGLSTGAISEEVVNEMGGVEAASARILQKQMGFLRSGQGRAMIAGAMGKGGVIDASQLSAYNNMTTTSMVERAAGRGLGVVQQAGTREARESAAPYANLMMMQAAASRMRQMGMEENQTNMVRMLGTLGLNRDEASLAMGSLRSERGAARQDARKLQELESGAMFAERRRTRGFIGATRTRIAAAIDAPAGGAGARFQADLSAGFSNVYDRFTGRRQRASGLEDEARAALLSGDMGPLRGSGGSSELKGVLATVPGMGMSQTDAAYQANKGDYTEFTTSSYGGLVKSPRAVSNKYLSSLANTLDEDEALDSNVVDRMRYAITQGAITYDRGGEGKVRAGFGALTASARGRQADAITYKLAKAGGIYTKSKQEFDAMSGTDRLRMRMQITKAIGNDDRIDATLRRQQAGGAEELQNLLLAGGIANTQEGIDAAVKRVGEIAGLGQASQRTLSEGGTKGKSIENAVADMVAAGADTGRSQRILDALSDEFGGPESAIVKEMALFSEKLKAGSAMASRDRRAGIAHELEQLGAGSLSVRTQATRLIKQQRVRERRAINDMRASGASMSPAMRNLAYASGKDRDLALGEIYSGMAGDGFDDKERSRLATLFGSEAMEDTTSLIAGLTKGDSTLDDVFKGDALGRAAFEKATKGMSAEARRDVAVQTLASKGLLRGENYNTGAVGASTADNQVLTAEAYDAMGKFVEAFGKFLADNPKLFNTSSG